MYKDLCVRDAYTVNGEEKVNWNKIGVLLDTKEGKQLVKLNHMPGAYIGVFEPKPKDEQPAVEGF